MRIQINKYILVILFLCANIITISFMVYFTYHIGQMTLFPIPVNIKFSNFAHLNKQVEDIHVNSKAFIIYDPKSRSAIAGKNEYFRFTPASTVKIMTALIAIEEYPLDKILLAAGVDEITGSKMKLEEGETITVESLLYGLMLPSGNDAAHVLSENYPGGKEAFVKRMNVRARDLRLENTHFVDPAGFENENYTTAFNLARLAAYAMENKVFRKIVSTGEKSVYDASGQIVHELKNLNALLGINGVNGVKTGFTEEAGGVLVTSVEQEGKEYTIVVLNSSDRFEDTQAIIINAIKNITLMSY